MYHKQQNLLLGLGSDGLTGDTNGIEATVKKFMVVYMKRYNFLHNVLVLLIGISDFASNVHAEKSQALYIVFDSSSL
jgi:hypothetical protein